MVLPIGERIARCLCGMLTKQRADEVHVVNNAQGQHVGALIRARRGDLSLSLTELAQRAGCAKSYLSSIETGRRAAPPSDDLLERLEEALGLPDHTLVHAARWQRIPDSVRLEVSQMRDANKAAQRLARILGHDGIDRRGRIRGSLDEAYRSGELRRLVERVAGDPALRAVSDGEPQLGALRHHLPVEIPLINKVAAGYPTEFTDLGFPARVADEYVRSPDLDDPDAFAARVVGDSMRPDYVEGDIVIFSPARDVASGMDCFARIEPDHESTFKRVYLERDGAGREMIRLQPLNSAYPPRTLEREEVAGLYPAVSVMRSVAHEP